MMVCCPGYLIIRRLIIVERFELPCRCQRLTLSALAFSPGAVWFWFCNPTLPERFLGHPWHPPELLLRQCSVLPVVPSWQRTSATCFMVTTCDINDTVPRQTHRSNHWCTV